MSKLLVIFIIALIACETELDALIFQQFEKFIKKYKKKYDSINEFLARYQVFRQNIMESFNEENSLYQTGITKFSDLTKQEFKRTYLNLNYNAMAMANFEPTYIKVTNAAPAAYDWRDYGRVAGVKDQGSCGSCWAFGTVSNIEGLYAKEKGVLKTFSEQMLVDCDTLDSGCNGGLEENAYTWLKKNGGIMFESDYPYTGRKGSCKSVASKYADIKVTGFKKLGGSSSVYSCVDEDEMKEFLYENGPVSVALNANPLQTYVSGILDVSSSKCKTSGINHSVSLVGYGSASVDYWIIKNSWGKNWGESGFFRIRRGNGTCGVNCYVLTALVSF